MRKTGKFKRIRRSGFWALDDEIYFADPVFKPSLSSSIAKELLFRSPRHAWFAHPRLNPDYKRVQKRQFDLGTAFHDGFRRRFDKLKIAPADMKDWRGYNADFRDAAYNKGLTPLLRREWNAVEDMITAARSQINLIEDLAGVYSAGKAEIALIWKERGVWCRCKLDWKARRGDVFPDLKSTKRSAHPDTVQTAIYQMNYDVQAAFYRRGIRAVLGIEEPQFKFISVELDPPHALSVVQLTPAAMDMADRKVDAAIDAWRWCTTNNSWPGYPSETAYVDPPGWAEESWTQREVREDDLGTEALFKMALDWQAPL